MNLNIQSILENERVILYPLQEKDFEVLYAVASDPKIWEQHPNKDRWKKDVFHTLFDGAIQSKGAFKIVDKTTGNVIGSTRFYDYNKMENSIFIGYTFYATSCWGKGINHLVKVTMLNYVFQFVSKVYFYIGANNVRSQMSIDRLGAEKIAKKKVTDFGEDLGLNFMYEISKQKWENTKSEK